MHILHVQLPLKEAGKLVFPAILIQPAPPLPTARAQRYRLWVSDLKLSDPVHVRISTRIKT